MGHLKPSQTSRIRSQSFAPPSFRLFLCICLGAAFFSAASPAQRISNPDLYLKSAKAAQEALDHYGVYDDPVEQRRVSEIAYRLAARSGYGDFPFSVYLIDMPDPNAFALPGGHLFVTRGMLALGLTDDMLANLLGHELAHVLERHGTRMRKRATILNILSQLLLVGVMVGADSSDDSSNNPYAPYSGSSRKGNLVQGAAATGMVISELLMRDYSREFEDEADIEGQRLAAAAGYDPDGARALWELMNERVPQKNQYGYWRTHPFSDVRMRAATVRAKQLTVLEGESPDSYRHKVQELILEFAAEPPIKKKKSLEPELARFFEYSALLAWPQGEHAERLRLAELHRRRDAELEKNELERDYGELMRIYAAALEEVRLLTPDSPFQKTVEGELEELRAAADGLRGKALEVWQEGVYQTAFLETFLSNYPEAEIRPQVALALGDAYSRLRRPADAVERYLEAAAAGPESEAGRRAVAGLRNLAPYLEDLAALQQLAEEGSEAELRELAAERLRQMSTTYAELANGGEYLRHYPAGTVAEKVRERLEHLANDLYGEVVLYQNLGDHLKALERIQKILTHAPDSSAAESLRDQAVLDV